MPKRPRLSPRAWFIASALLLLLPQRESLGDVQGRAGLQATPSTQDILQNPDVPVHFTAGDVLNLYSEILTLQMKAGLPKDNQDLDMSMVLLDKNGQTTLIISFPESIIAKFQVSPPAKQIQGLQGFHTLFWTLFTKIASGEVDESRFGDLAAGLYRSSPINDMLSAFLASRTQNDFVLRVGFEQDGQAHLYATVTGKGVEFSPLAPKAKAE